MRKIWMLLLFCGSLDLIAESRPLASAIPVSSPFAPRPVGYRDDDWVYREYVSGKDSHVVRRYQDRWAYHNTKTPFAGVSVAHEHLDIGSLEHAPSESDVRQQFAQEVFRVRVDHAFRKYFESEDRAPSLRQASHALQKARDYRLIKSDVDESIRREFIVGYDVFSDQSRIEYLHGSLFAGFIHPHLAGSLFGGAKDMYLHFGVIPVGTVLPGTRFAYFMGEQRIEARFTRPLSSSLSTVVTSGCASDMRNGWFHRLEVVYQIHF